MVLRYRLLLFVSLISLMIIRIYGFDQLLPVSGQPWSETIRIYQTPEINGYQQRLEARGLTLILPKEPHLRLGDEVELRGILMEEEAWSPRYVFSGQVKLLKRLSDSSGAIPGLRPEYYLQRLVELRNYLKQRLEAVFYYPSSGLLIGMLLGDGQEIPKSLYDDLKSSGLVHLVVASGSNLAIISSFLLAFTQAWIGWRQRLITVVLITLGYAVMTGLEPPILRAFAMLFGVWSSQFIGRKTPIVYILGEISIILIIINPSLFRSLSFYLSLVATCGVLIGLPMVDRRNTIKTSSQWPNKLLQPILAQCGVYIWLAPLLGFAFGLTNPWSIGANLIVTPLVSPLLALASFGLGLSLVWLPLGQSLSWVAQLLVLLILRISNMISNLPFSHINISINIYICFLIYFSLFFIVWRVKTKPFSI